METYRRLPLAVQAMQCRKETVNDLFAWVSTSDWGIGYVTPAFIGGVATADGIFEAAVPVPNGLIHIREGEWLVQVPGVPPHPVPTYYVCSNKAFRREYERVDQEDIIDDEDENTYQDYLSGQEP